MNMNLAHLGLGVAAGVMLAAVSMGEPVDATARVASAGVMPEAPVVGRQEAVSSGGQVALGNAVGALRGRQWATAVSLYTPLVNSAAVDVRGQARYGLALGLAQLGQEDKALQALEGTLVDTTPLGQAVGELRARLLLQLADKALAEQGTAAANVWLAQYERLTTQPDKARYERIKGASQPVEAAPSLVLRVGVMVPLHGALAPIGEDIVRGLQMGLKEFDGRRGTRLELLPMDVADAESGKTAALALLAQRVDVVVGPLLAPAVDAAEPVLAGKVPMLALSSDRAVLGRDVHGLNHLPGEQARTMARAAVAAGKRKLAGLVPSTPYGYDVFEAFQDEAKRLGVEVVGSGFYNPQVADIGATIRTLTGNVSGSVPFDALFLPAPAKTLPLVTSQLAYYDVNTKDVQLLGTALWQDPSVLNPSASSVRGGLFAVPGKAPEFEAAFRTTYGSEAHPLAVLGYDAARILADIAGEKQRTGKAVGELLLRPEGFYGDSGYVRFTTSGVAERGLSTVKVGEQFEVVQPALNMLPLPLPTELVPSGVKRNWGW